MGGDLLGNPPAAVQSGGAKHQWGVLVTDVGGANAKHADITAQTIYRKGWQLEITIPTRGLPCRPSLKQGVVSPLARPSGVRRKQPDRGHRLRQSRQRLTEPSAFAHVYGTYS